jgi:excisionase family DNA binding protein
MDTNDTPTPNRRQRERSVERLHTLLTVDEAAAFLRVNRKTLYEAVQLGHVPGIVRFGRAIRLSKDALLQWLRTGPSPLTRPRR